MPQVQIRGGTKVQARTRRIDNIIFDSVAEVTVQYVNYYYDESKEKNIALEKLRTSITFETITSKLEYNHLELDFLEGTTSPYVPIGTESMEKFATVSAPPIDYVAIHNEFLPGKFVSSKNHRERFSGDDSSRFVVLDDNFRKTATMPLRHVHTLNNPNDSGPGDAFHFSILSRNILTENPKVRVSVYRSTLEYEDAIENLDEFQRGLSSVFVQSFDYSIEGVGWNRFVINLRTLNIPIGNCLLWFVIERLPIIIENPFDIPSGEYNESFNETNIQIETIVDDNSETKIYRFLSSIDDWIDNDTLTTRPFSIQINGVDLTLDVDFSYQLFKHRETIRKLEITFSDDVLPLTQEGELSSFSGVLTVEPRTTGVNSYAILSNWYKFSHGAIFTDGSAIYPSIPSEIDSWQVNADDAISYTRNSRSYIGFVSPDPIESYELETQVSSTGRDDDAIGVVIGFAKDEDYEYTLSAVRVHGGMFGGVTWMLATNIAQTISFNGRTISDKISSHRWYLRTPAGEIDYETIPNIGRNWSNTPTGAKIKIRKEGNIIKAWTSQMNSDVIDPASLIEIDLNEYEDTKKFINSRFGFSTYSQSNSKFTNISFSPIIGETNLEDIKAGELFVGGFATEIASTEVKNLNPKANHEFIDSITAERFIIDGPKVAKEKFNFITFELTSAIDTDSENFIDLIKPSLYAGTILDYTNISMLLKTKKLTFTHNPFTGFRIDYLTENIDSQLVSGESLVDILNRYISPTNDLFAAQKLVEIIEGKDAAKRYVEFISSEMSQNIIQNISGEFTSTGVSIENISSEFAISQNISKKIIEVGYAGIKYEFSYDPIDRVQNLDSITKELNLSEFISISDIASIQNYGRELNRAVDILKEQDLVMDIQSGLYYFEPQDYLNDITKSMYFGKPKDSIIPINYGFQKYTDSTEKYKKYIELSKDILFEFEPFAENPIDILFNSELFIEKPKDIEYDTPWMNAPSDIVLNTELFYENLKTINLSNLEFNEILKTVDISQKDFYEELKLGNITQKDFYEIVKSIFEKEKVFYEIPRNIILGDKTWNEKIKIIEINYPKTSFFERAKDIRFDAKPFYTETLSKTYINKIFFVDMDMWNKTLNFSGFELETQDVSYFIEQYFMQTNAVTPTIGKTIFGKKMLEEIFRPNFRIIEKVLEFFFDSFVGVSSNLFDVNKFQPTFYDKITSFHPRNGGSNAYGHEVLENGRSLIARSKKPVLSEYVVENNFEAAGRSGRHETNVYSETQVITDINSNFLFEFSTVDWNLETNSKMNEIWAFNNENNKFNFLYDIEAMEGRIPECLTLTSTGRLTGKLSETDKFLRKYAFEPWVKTQGFTNSNGEFVSHFDSLDYDYTDFEVVDPREFSVRLVGRNITTGTIDIIAVNDGDELVPGEVVRQGLSNFVVGPKVTTFNKDVNLGNGIVNKTILRYELERLEGDINITRIERVLTDVFVTSSSILINNIAELNEQILFSENLQTTEVLLQRRNKLQSLLDAVGPDEGIFATETASETVEVETIEQEDGTQFYVDDFLTDNSGAVIKQVTLIFRIYNNYSFDRDLFIHKSPQIDDSLFASRTEWLEANRENNNFRYSSLINNRAIDSEVIDVVRNYYNSKISEVEYNARKAELTELREYTNPEQYNKYMNFLDSLSRDGTNYDLSKLLDVDYFTKEFPILPSKFEYLENIANENGTFTLNCEYEVDEKTFYEATDDIRIIRGYPVYASCN